MTGLAVGPIFNLERYISSYPNDKNIAYAHFLVAIVYYENIQNETNNILIAVSHDIFKEYKMDNKSVLYAEI